uniref:Fibronectin type-III domain-containing protein n=1 Tax=Gadus morhua TaxID=8049 RepID=A0A8C5FGD1_GADMO
MNGLLYEPDASLVESGAVQSLKVAAVNTNSAVVSWNRVPGATGYRLAWGPTHEFTGRDRPRQLALNSSTTEYHLRNVVYDTEYVLSLYVLFGTVVGPGITATFRTSPLGYVSNFEVVSYTSTSIDVEWSPIVGATEYKVTWKTSKGHCVPQSRYLEKSVLFQRVEGLRPGTAYTVSIHAVYGNTEGPEISLSQFTAALSGSELIQTVREVKLVDIEVNSISLSWRATNGVTGYKVSWSHFQGGGLKSQLVPAPATTFTIPDLQGSSAYKIQVSSMLGSREGSPALVTARTLDLPKVNGFTALNTTDNGTLLSWASVAGASGYLLSWRHISELDTKTETLGLATSYKVLDLLYGRTYIFTIRPLYGEVEGPVTTVYQRIRKHSPPGLVNMRHPGLVNMRHPGLVNIIHSGLVNMRHSGLVNMRHPGLVNIRHSGLVNMRHSGLVNMRHSGLVKIRHPGLVNMRHSGLVKIRQPGLVNMRHSGLVKIRHPGLVNMRHSGLVNIRHSGLGKIRHYGLVNIRHYGLVNIRHSGLVNIRHSGLVKIRHSGLVNIRHSCLVNIRHSGLVNIRHSGLVNIRHSGLVNIRHSSESAQVKRL